MSLIKNDLPRIPRPYQSRRLQAGGRPLREVRGMTWITDDSGTRWVEDVPRKRRAPAKGRRFAKLKVGDQLVTTSSFFHQMWEKVGRLPTYFLVTDAWFDPVEGFETRERGEFFAIQQIAPNGVPSGRKNKHTRLGLAQRGYHYADIDYIALGFARSDSGEAIVGIHHGRTIRARPKSPGHRL